MTLLEAIQARHSVRKYIERPIDADVVEALQRKVEEVNREGDLHIQLVTNEPRAFHGKMAYGTFSGVTNYFVMAGRKDAPAGGTAQASLSERIGYYGEQLVLLAQTLGLGTCWAGLTYNNIKEAYTIGPDERLCCMIALGYGNDAGRNMRRKSIDKVSNAGQDSPLWFRQGVEAALLAPTAVNQQKFFFTYLGTDDEGKGMVKAERKFSLFGYTKMDLGIARLHFEIGAGKENFNWV